MSKPVDNNKSQYAPLPQVVPEHPKSRYTEWNETSTTSTINQVAQQNLQQQQNSPKSQYVAPSSVQAMQQARNEQYANTNRHTLQPQPKSQYNNPSLATATNPPVKSAYVNGNIANPTVKSTYEGTSQVAALNESKKKERNALYSNTNQVAQDALPPPNPRHSLPPQTPSKESDFGSFAHVFDMQPLKTTDRPVNLATIFRIPSNEYSGKAPLSSNSSEILTGTPPKETPLTSQEQASLAKQADEAVTKGNLSGLERLLMFQESQSLSKSSLLETAYKYGHVPIIIFLETKLMLPSIAKNPEPYAMHALEHDHQELFKFFFESQAIDPKDKTKAGQSWLHVAKTYDKKWAVTYLEGKQPAAAKPTEKQKKHKSFFH